MKQFYSIGELFVAYRNYNGLSQTNLADQLDVDLRTVQRWEQNLTLIKSNKEEDIVLATLLPYQLIRNLNATVPIPTYYDFHTRKYSLSIQTNELPKLNWYKEQMDLSTNNLRTIDPDLDLKYIDQFIDSQKRDKNYVNNALIKEAVRLLPELNVIITGESGYYAGHCIVLPISEETYTQLYNRNLGNTGLRAHHLADYRKMERPIFYRYDITGDCNDTIFYVMSTFFRFFLEIDNQDYIFCGYTERDDNYDLNKQVGLNVVWEDHELQKKLGTAYPPRFSEGNFHAYLSNLS